MTTRREPRADEPIRVVVADDSYLLREAIRELLSGLPEVELVATCADGDALWKVIELESPDVVVADVRMPPSGEGEGLRIARRLRETRPWVGVVALSQYAEPRYGLELIDPSAEGRAYLLKQNARDREELLLAIETVARGGSMIDPGMVGMMIDAQRQPLDSPLSRLTTRERQVLSEMAHGKSNGAIAEALVLSKRAVEKHVGSIFDKLGLPGEDMVSRRVAAVLLYLGDTRGR